MCVRVANEDAEEAVLPVASRLGRLLCHTEILSVTVDPSIQLRHGLPGERYDSGPLTPIPFRAEPPPRANGT